MCWNFGTSCMQVDYMSRKHLQKFRLCIWYTLLVVCRWFSLLAIWRVGGVYYSCHCFSPSLFLGGYFFSLPVPLFFAPQKSQSRFSSVSSAIHTSQVCTRWATLRHDVPSTHPKNSGWIGPVAALASQVVSRDESHQASVKRWAPNSYKWSYGAPTNPYKWVSGL